MNPWDLYSARINTRGKSRRDVVLRREAHALQNKVPNNLSYHQAIVDGVPQSLSIINSDHLEMKTLLSMPGEDIPHGALIEWMDNKWLVVEKDANTELYAKCIMRQCNYLLRWIADNGNIVERWSIVEDGTKYLIGEYGDNNYVVTRGDTRLALTVPRDEYTLQLNRENRFIIDDYGSRNVLAYRLSKPLKLGWHYNGEGCIRFILQECNTEDSDNLELHIANYYEHFSRDVEESNNEPAVIDAGIVHEQNDNSGRKVWL